MSVVSEPAKRPRGRPRHQVPSFAAAEKRATRAKAAGATTVQHIEDIARAAAGRAKGAGPRPGSRVAPRSLSDVERLLADAAVGKAHVDTGALKQLADHLRASGKVDDTATVDAMLADLKQCPHCGKAL